MIHVMVVDDERDIESLFKQKFRREVREGKVELHFCFSGEDAFQRLKTAEAADIILILSDINMPGMTGLELLGMIKKELPGREVIMVTAYGDAETRKKAKELGADDFVTKPIDFDALKKRMGLG